MLLTTKAVTFVQVERNSSKIVTLSRIFCFGSERSLTPMNSFQFPSQDPSQVCRLAAHRILVDCNELL